MSSHSVCRWVSTGCRHLGGAGEVGEFREAGQGGGSSPGTGECTALMGTGLGDSKGAQGQLTLTVHPCWPGPAPSLSRQPWLLWGPTWLPQRFAHRGAASGSECLPTQPFPPHSCLPTPPRPLRPFPLSADTRLRVPLLDFYVTELAQGEFLVSDVPGAPTLPRPEPCGLTQGLLRQQAAANRAHLNRSSSWTLVRTSGAGSRLCKQGWWHQAEGEVATLQAPSNTLHPRRALGMAAPVPTAPHPHPHGTGGAIPSPAPRHKPLALAGVWPPYQAPSG